MTRKPRDLIAWLALAGVCGLASAAAAAAPGGGRWTLVRTFEPIPTLQRGIDTWISVDDAEKGWRAGSPVRQVRTLGFGDDGHWSIVTERFFCGRGRIEVLRRQAFAPDGSPRSDVRDHEGPEEIIPHMPDASEYDLVCGRGMEAGRIVDGIPAALAIERAADAEFARRAASTRR